MSTREVLVFFMILAFPCNFFGNCQENFGNLRHEGKWARNSDSLLSEKSSDTISESATTCPIHGEKCSRCKLGITHQFSNNEESSSRRLYFDGINENSGNPSNYMIAPISDVQPSQEANLYYILEPENVEHLSQFCSNCQKSVEPGKTVATNSLEESSSSNPNCNCQNCKCADCRCGHQPSKVCRGTTTNTHEHKTCKYNSRGKKAGCQCHCDPQDSGCRTKRHVEDFGKLFTNLVPRQFKDFHSAVAHMRSSPKQQNQAVPQKFSLLNQLENIHKRSSSRHQHHDVPQKFSLRNQLESLHKQNNAVPFKQPNLGQKYSIENDISQKYQYYNPANRFQDKNMKQKIPMGPAKHITMNTMHPDPLSLEKKYNKLKKVVDDNIQKIPSKMDSNFLVRSSLKNNVDKTVLLRKLKRLNGNFLNQKLEDQATDFMKKCLVPNNAPPKPNKIRFSARNAEFNKNYKDANRRKRTIILSSDELDLPAHYEVEVVSDEEQPQDEFVGNRNNDFYEQYEEEDECSCETPEEEQSYEQLQGFYQNPVLQQTNPIYQHAPVLQQKYPPILSRPSYNKPIIPALLKPEVIVGKNVIKKAVQEELDNYHKKIEREQKLKELKQKRNHPFGYGKNGIPQNPMFMLFNAPIDFLRQFHNLNQKSINPVMTTLPNLVYTAKKYFKNFGKDFKNNCMNLASNIIGDFDNVNPNVIESIVKPNRYRRDARVLNEEINSKAERTTNAQNSEDVQNFRHGLGTKVKNKLNQTIENITALETKDIKKESNEDRYYIKIKPKDAANKIISTTEITQSDSRNFCKVPSSSVRKKRYVIKVVDSDEVQSQVEEYLTQKLNFKPLFENRFSQMKPVVQQPHTQQDDDMEDYDYYSESSEEKPKKKKVQIKKVKPRVIIDNKGLAFMEYNGMKRPLLFSNRKKSGFMNTEDLDKKSSEEVGNAKIDMLIQRAKEHTDLVGNTQSTIVPQKVIKERITHLLDEIDHLVNLKLENYDQVCEDLIKIHQIKISIEEDWKRLLIDNKIDDIQGKITILGKLRDLQNVKNQAVKHIGETLQKNNNEFVRKFLISILAKLQRLQSLITGVIEDFETRFQMQTPFNTKKEIKFVDYLSDLKFITEKTRNDLVKNIGKKRDEEVQRDIDILNKLKKLLHIEEADSEKFENTAKIIWEMMNACKLQKDTVKEMNRKLSRNQNVKKELKILFDLQNRFDEANGELQESLISAGLGTSIKFNNEVVKKGDKPKKKNVQDILADIKRKQEEWVKKFKKQ